MAMLAGDYTRRVCSTQRNSAVTAGTGNDPVHIPANSTNFKICQESAVFVTLSINATSTGTNLFFQDTNGTTQMVAVGLTVARDYKLHFYCPWPLYISTDVDCTAIVSPAGKNVTAPV